MPQRAPAENYHPQSPGRRVADPPRPSPRIRLKRYGLKGGGRLAGRAGKAGKIVWKSPQTLGLECGELMPWFQHGASPELPGDQRADDGKSICFDSPPLTKT